MHEFILLSPNARARGRWTRVAVDGKMPAAAVYDSRGKSQNES